MYPAVHRNDAIPDRLHDLDRDFVRFVIAVVNLEVGAVRTSSEPVETSLHTFQLEAHLLPDLGAVRVVVAFGRAEFSHPALVNLIAQGLVVPSTKLVAAGVRRWSASVSDSPSRGSNRPCSSR